MNENVIRECDDCGDLYHTQKRDGIILSKVCMKCRNKRYKKYREQVKAKKPAAKKRVTVDTGDIDFLLGKLKEEFHKYIRNRDKDGEMFYCGTCKTWKKIKGDNYHACHLFPAGPYPALRFHEDNVHGGCKSCNYYKHGAGYEYNEYVIEKIGQERYNALIELKDYWKGRRWEWDKEELINKIRYYQILNKETQ